MSPYKIEMCVNSYSKDKEPLYNLIICANDGHVIEKIEDMPKEYCIKYLASYCCVSF